MLKPLLLSRLVVCLLNFFFSAKELADELERKRELWMCKVCMDAEMEVVFLPCSHMVACSSCALALAQCPICREDIKYSVKPILS